MPRYVDLTDQVFGRWRVDSYAGCDNKSQRAKWWCECTCGTWKVILSSNLLRGKSQSCGCWMKERLITHGLHNIPEYQVWADMKQRCHNPSYKGRKNYGGRGIRVWPAWRRSFEAFYAHMGSRPGPEYSIERIDNERGYYPGNCRWATPLEQRHNQRIPQMRCDNKSGYTGVIYRKDTGKWQAYITEGRRIHLGYYTTPEEASQAYQYARQVINAELAIV
jgi:AP2 domain